MEFGTDGCGRAVVAGQSGRQFRVAGVGGRVHQPDVEAVRHSREHQPARSDYRIHGVNADTDAHSDPNSNTYSDDNTHADGNSNPIAHSNTYSDCYSDAYSHTDGNTHPYGNCHTYSNSNAHTNTHSDNNTYTDANAHTNTYSDNNTPTYPNANADAYTFFASVALPACYHRRERASRHQSRVRADIGRAMHNYVDVRRDIPRTHYSETDRADDQRHLHK